MTNREIPDHIKRRIEKLIREMQESITWGGSEDEHGDLMPGEPDLEMAEKEMANIAQIAYAQGIMDVIELMKENDYPEETKYAEYIEKLFAADLKALEDK